MGREWETERETERERDFQFQLQQVKCLEVITPILTASEKLNKPKISDFSWTHQRTEVTKMERKENKENRSWDQLTESRSCWSQKLAGTHKRYFEKLLVAEWGLPWKWKNPGRCFSLGGRATTFVGFTFRGPTRFSWRSEKNSEISEDQGRIPSCFRKEETSNPLNTPWWKLIILKYRQSVLQDKDLSSRANHFTRALSDLGNGWLDNSRPLYPSSII